MADETPEQYTRARLKASRNVGIGLTALTLTMGGVLAFAFNATSVGRPDLGEKNVARYTDQEMRRQVHTQFNTMADKVAEAAVRNGAKIEPGNVMVLSVQGGVMIDPAKAHDDAVALIKDENTQQKGQGNTLAVALGLAALVCGIKTFRENRRLNTLDPPPAPQA